MPMMTIRGLAVLCVSLASVTASPTPRGGRGASAGEDLVSLLYGTNNQQAALVGHSPSANQALVLDAPVQHKYGSSRSDRHQKSHSKSVAGHQTENQQEETFTTTKGKPLEVSNKSGRKSRPSHRRPQQVGTVQGATGLTPAGQVPSAGEAPIVDPVPSAGVASGTPAVGVPAAAASAVNPLAAPGVAAGTPASGLPGVAAGAPASGLPGVAAGAPASGLPAAAAGAAAPKKPPPLPLANPLGCVKEPSKETRLFKHRLDAAHADTSGNSTYLSCATLASKQNLTYFGLEYGGVSKSGDCWGGPTPSVEIPQVTVPMAECDMACKADTNQTCGGSLRLTAFMFPSLVGATPNIMPIPDALFSPDQLATPGESGPARGAPSSPDAGGGGGGGGLSADPTLAEQNLSDCQYDIIIQLTSTYETSSQTPDFGACHNNNDGQGISAGFVQFTTSSGSALKVVEEYKALGGDKFTSFEGSLQRARAAGSQGVTGGGVTDGLENFCDSWKNAADTDKERFGKAQKKVEGDLYLKPNKETVQSLGLKKAASVGQLFDSAIQLGLSGMQSIVQKVQAPPPAKGGDEQKWLQEYLQRRSEKLAEMGGAYAGTTYRVKSYQHIVDKGNMDLSGTVEALENGGGVINLTCKK
ncbi:hypothetical protein HDU67_005677 [Dinochytrium kinnereticum]|nr:hypothetical protein HDU67_005677 [Dinochytrium kinnereticum]